jgi:hypothetical protein
VKRLAKRRNRSDSSPATASGDKHMIEMPRSRGPRQANQTPNPKTGTKITRRITARTLPMVMTYAASGTARARASACDNRASMVRSV